MAKLTWLGEDHLHNGTAGPSFTTGFGGLKFPKGVAVEVTDKGIIAKARNNPFFEVSPAIGVNLRSSLKVVHDQDQG